MRRLIAHVLIPVFRAGGRSERRREIRHCGRVLKVQRYRRKTTDRDSDGCIIVNFVASKDVGRRWHLDVDLLLIRSLVRFSAGARGRTC